MNSRGIPTKDRKNIDIERMFYAIYTSPHANCSHENALKKKVGDFDVWVLGHRIYFHWNSNGYAIITGIDNIINFKCGILVSDAFRFTFCDYEQEVFIVAFFAIFKQIGYTVCIDDLFRDRPDIAKRIHDYPTTWFEMPKTIKGVKQNPTD